MTDMPVAGLRGTGDWGADERPKDFREMILWMQPNGDTPLLGLTSKAGKGKAVTDPEFSWWNEAQDIVRLETAEPVGSSIMDQLIVVDPTDPDGTDIKRNFGLATHLTPGDILMVEPAADSLVDDYERVIVRQVHSDTHFTVERGAFGTSISAFGPGTYLLLIGSVFAEGTAEPQATTRNPIKYSNYTQIFKTTYELTGTAEQTTTRTGDPVSNDKKRRSFDHAKKLEFAMLFGKKSERISPINGKPERTMGGIREFLPQSNVHILNSAWGLAKSAAPGNNLIDMVSPVFDYVSPAGDTRIAMCGNGTLNAINRAILSSSGASGVSIYWGAQEKLWGMNFRELVFPQGRILLKTHPLLSRHSMYTYSMWLLDFSSIKYRPMKNRDTKPIDNIQQKGEDARRGMWQTECSLEVDYAGQTNAYIGGFDQDAA